MNDFNKGRVEVTLADGVSEDWPIIPRKYTLTHSDETGQLFLSIGKCYDFSKVNDSRDEVLGAWVCNDDGSYILKMEVLLDGAGDEDITEIRNNIFRRELPLAIKAIIYGDRKLLSKNESLYDCKMYIRFKSRYEKYNVEELWGCVKDYKVEECSEDCRSDEFRLIADADNNEINVEKFSPMNMEGNMVKYPMPFPPDINYPNSPGFKNKNTIIERALIDMLSLYIQNEVYMSFGRNTPFCLRQSEVLNARVVATYGPCRQEYEVTVGVKAGRTPPPFFNLIITFIINNSRVTVKAVKSPREV